MLPVAIIGSSLFGSEASSDAADTAAQASGQASDASIAEQRRQYDQSRADYAPYLAAGTESVNRLANELRPGGRFAGTTPFSFNYADYKDPSLQFSLDENLRRMRHGRAAAGTYAGGGGGAVYTGAGSVGGVGGGGNGGTSISGTGVAGAANTGGGGGGGRAAAGGAGGSGIVILRYPDTFIAATSTTGSPTITVAGGFRVYKFTASGSITF